MTLHDSIGPCALQGLFGQDPAGLNSNAAFGGSGRRLQQAVAASFAYSPGLVMLMLSLQCPDSESFAAELTFTCIA